MRAVIFARNNEIEVVDRPAPEPGPDEVLLKIGGAGVCHSDLAIIGSGDDSPWVGGILGHEAAGTVDRVGDKVEGWQPGDRAVVSLILSCGNCRECAKGRDNYCEVAYPRDALAPLCPGIGSPGGMVEHLVVKPHNLVPLDKLDPADAAPLADAALTPMHAINRVRPRLTGDATVVVIGLGGLGHMGIQLLKATTGARIIALDTDPEKVNYAQEHGVHLALPSDAQAADRVLEATDGKGADVVLDFVGVQPTADLAVHTVRNGGAIMFVGLGGAQLDYLVGNGGPIPWGIQIERPYGGTVAELREVIQLAEDGRIGVQVNRYSLDDAVQAFDDLHHGRVQGRAVLVP